ncbi:glutaredoxin-related protein 5, mitochondrial [Anopheles bellator]|uniref:glutaredoxin-related protein 5, mitochondrial n=1 Tax=Anopheles bellator TaxID=139047 RepID=UPI002649FFDD|nr:glutaredoxin-related protein 5, mitochondrial [Anopheles bellator]
MNVLGRNIARNLLRYNRCGLIQSVAGRNFSASALDAKEVEKLVKNNKVVVFMKGNPDAPRCGFSNAVVQVLRMHSVNYDSHDVLQSEELRQGIKDFSSWPTIPQVFINGEFVGGCDILLQMHQNGELIEELKKAGIESALVKEAEK